MTSDRGRFAGILEFLFRKIEGLRPDQPVNAIKQTSDKSDGTKKCWYGSGIHLT